MVKPLLYVIKELIPKLPGKDAELCAKFLQERRFEDIYEIVKSDIYLTTQDALKEVPSEKYLNANIEELIKLKQALEEYTNLLQIPVNGDMQEEPYYD